MPWGDLDPVVNPGYLNDDEFSLSMDSTFGAGNWTQTGGWRSQARENALRAQGAQTVAPGHVSAHSVGDEDSPGARDIVVKGMSPDHAAQVMRQNGTFGANQMYPEGASGTQGAHLHLGMQPNAHPTWGSADPVVPAWGQDDPVVGQDGQQQAKPGLLEQAGRAGASAVGGIVKSAGDVLHSLGITNDAIAQNYAKQIADTGMMVVGEETIQATPEQIAEAKAAVASHKKYFSPDTEPTAKALQQKGEEIAPKNRNLLESILHGAGEMTPALGAAAVNPALGVGVFAMQGYSEAYDDALAHGASPEEADKAARANAAIQGGLGAVPVGHAAEALTHGIGSAVARVGSRYAASAGGNAALMGAMRAGGNVVARQTYDPNRDWADQVPQSMAQGAFGDLMIHGAHDAAATGVRAAQGLLRPRESPASPGTSPGLSPEAMPQTDAIRAYAGQGPVNAEAPPAPAPGEESTWTPEREAKWQVWAQNNPGAEPVHGDPVLFQTPEGMAHGIVTGETADHQVVVDTPAGPVTVPPDQAVPLPKDYEGERIVHGAPLEQMPQAIADITELRQAAPKGYSLFQAMKDLGGIRNREADGSQIGDVQDVLDKVRRPGLINNKTGLSPDGMRAALQERGWFGSFDQSQGAEDFGDARPGDDINALYELMRREASGNKVLHPTEDGTAGRRASLEDQVRQAGVAISDAPETAAAKLAAWRGEQVMAHSPDMTELRERAQQLGMDERPSATYDSLLADVVEREAIPAEAEGSLADHYEERTDVALTPEEHEWLTAAGRRPEGEPDPAFPVGAALGETGDHTGPQEGAGEPRAGAEGGGEDAGSVPRPNQLKPSASYIIVDRQTGKPVMETFNRSTAARVNLERYEVLPVMEWLQRYNRAVKDNGGHEPDMTPPPSERVNLANGPADQLLIPGGERSALQAAAAREGPLKAKAPQQEAGGLFAPPEPDQSDLKFAKPPVFYSTLERHIDNSTLKSATPEQWKATIRNAPGLKKEELEWTGVNDWLDLFGQDKVPKDKLQAFIRDNGVKVEEKVLRVAKPAPGHEHEFFGVADDDVQFQDWTLPGGQDYRELLLTLPKEANPPATHWDTPGVMAHVRFDTRTAPDGKKVLFVQEIQSDWHQKGRDQGYEQGANPAALQTLERNVAAHAANAQKAAGRIVEAASALRDKMADDGTLGPGNDLPPWRRQGLSLDDSASVASRWLLDEAPDEQRYGDDLETMKDAIEDWRVSRLQRREVEQQLHNARHARGIPNAPFKSSWPALVMKRTIRWAVDHGFDRVAWTTGAQQEERYWGHELMQAPVQRWNEIAQPQRVREELLEHFGRELAAVTPLEIVDAPMLGALKDNQVRRAVVQAIPVDVVHILAKNGLKPDQLLSQPDMVGVTLPVDSRAAVARGLAHALSLVGARLRTALDRVLSTDARGRDEELHSAVRASDLSASEVYRLLTTRGPRGATGGEARSVLSTTRPGATGSGAEAPVGSATLRGEGRERTSAELADLLNRHAEIIADRTGNAIQYVQPPPGEGMRSFYDRNLVNITNDLIKKYGAKVEETRVPTTDLRSYEANVQFHEAHAARTSARGAQLLAESARKTLAEQREGSVQHGFDITPAMKEAASGGLPLFKRRQSAEPDFLQPKGVLVGRAVPGDREAKTFADKVEAAVRKIAPFAEVVPARHITELATGDKAMGVSWRDGLRHIIGWSVDHPDAVGIARHEAVHALRGAGLIRPEEWETLESAASEEDWRGRYNIDRRYGDLEHDKQMEEAIAERFREWRRDGEKGLAGIVQTVFQRIAKILDAVRDLAKRTFGMKASAADIFSRMESGEIGRRMGKEANETGRADAHDVESAALARPPRAGANADRAAREAAAQREIDEKEGRINTPTAKAHAIDRVINQTLGVGVENAGQKLQRAAEKALPDPVVDALHDTAEAVNMAINPMSAGSGRAQAAAKDFANALRLADHQHEHLDKYLDRHFTGEQQRRMWEAADEEGVILRRGEISGPGQGLNRLDAEERAAVLNLQDRADNAFDEASALGMVKGDGLESYVPRMVVQMTAFGPKVPERSSPSAQRKGGNLSTTTGQLRQRKYETTGETETAAQTAFGDKATVVRNIRTLPLATQRLERAIAGRTLINRIKELSSQTGEPLVVEGQKPFEGYFTMEHPAMQVWRPRFVKDENGKLTAAVDQNGDVVFDAHPLWVAKEFEGPLKAVLSTPTGPIIRAFSELKAKMMGVIMYSPLMHNAVIWGRALAADPVGVASLEAYRRGSRAKRDPETMAEAINAGLVPISRHFQKIDAAALAEADASFVPGRSWTSQILGYIPGLFSKDAGDAVKAKIDQFGDVWHNTFLWDRVGDLQMGLYTKMRDDLTRKASKFGISEQTAQRIAAHYANRYAGSLPMEGMSKVARQVANWMLFSRSFTLGNLAAFKDVTKGLPSEVRGQIERDAGAGELMRAQGIARRKAIGMLVLDTAFAWAGLWLAAGATAWLTQQRFQAPSDNEDKYKNRFLLRYQSDGTAVYGRMPTGKTVEDLWHWPTQPITTLHQKLSPYGRLVSALWSNDKGFGRKLYDPYDHTPAGVMKNVGRIVWDTMQSIAPTGQLQGMKDAAVGGPGVDRKTALLQALLPVAGITVSKGAPGGPAMGDYYNAKDEHDFQVQQAMPAIQKQIKTGDIAGARQAMTTIGIAPGLQNYYVRVAQNPNLRMSGRKLRDFERFADDRQKAQFAADRAATSARGAQ